MRDIYGEEVLNFSSTRHPSILLWNLPGDPTRLDQKFRTKHNDHLSCLGKYEGISLYCIRIAYTFDSNSDFIWECWSYFSDLH